MMFRLRTVVNKVIVSWKLEKELNAAGIQHQGMSLFGDSLLEVILVDENQAGQALTVIEAHTGIDTIQQRLDAAEAHARAIPTWATWDETQALDWWEANLSDGQVDLIANLADAKVMLKKQNSAIRAMARLLIAMRDRLWPHLPEG